MLRATIKKGSHVLDIQQAPTLEQLNEVLNKFRRTGVWGKQETRSEEQLVSEAIPAVTEEREILDENGASFDPPQFETVVIEAEVPAVYETVVIQGDYEIVIEDVTSELERQKVNEEALKYLAQTDWLVIRFQETGTAIPQDVLDKRAAARAAVVRG